MDLARLERQARSVRLPILDVGREFRAGRHYSKQRGHGFLFADAREYQFGDDIRSVDWNVTARLGKPYVKVFEQERGSGVLLVLDLSASVREGAAGARKAALMREVAVLLALAARHHGERIGALLCSDRAEKIIPARRGHEHTQVVIRDLRHWQPTKHATGLAKALQTGRVVMRRPGLVIILSDFMDRDYAASLRALRARHEVLALCIKDPAEATLSNTGIVRYRDLETGATRLVDTASAAVRLAYENKWKQLDAERAAVFEELAVPSLDLHVGRPYLSAINELAGRGQGR